MAWNFELYHSAKRGFIEENVPVDVAEAASRILASEDEETQRTPEQQQIITRAWRYLFKLPPQDGAVLGKNNGRETTNY